MEDILGCRKCGICENQLPLLDNVGSSRVMCVGLSAKRAEKGDVPFSSDTNSGKLVEVIEKRLGCRFYRTNLVKCLPLADNGKLRYPSLEEKEMCYDNLVREIALVKPEVVVLFGKVVSEFVLGKYGIRKVKLDKNFNYGVCKFNGVCFVAVHHPSYIYVYKRKRVKEYIEGIARTIRLKN